MYTSGGKHNHTGVFGNRLKKTAIIQAGGLFTSGVFTVYATAVVTLSCSGCSNAVPDHAIGAIVILYTFGGFLRKRHGLPAGDRHDYCSLLVLTAGGCYRRIPQFWR